MSLEEYRDSLEEEVIDVATEVAQLRLHYYDELRGKKEEEEKRRIISSTRGPTKRQMQLYEEGTVKLLLKKIKDLEAEESADRRNDSAPRRPPTPIPICDRLYEQGMAKVNAEKMAQKKAEEMLNSSTTRRKQSISPIPICDRLYQEGMNKIVAEKEKKKSRYLNNSSLNPRPSSASEKKKRYSPPALRHKRENEHNPNTKVLSSSPPRRIRNRSPSSSFRIPNNE